MDPALVVLVDLVVPVPKLLEVQDDLETLYPTFIISISIIIVIFIINTIIISILL